MKFNLNKSSIIFVLSFLFLFIIQCKKEKKPTTEETPTKEEKVDSAKQDSIRKDSIEKAHIKFSAFIFPKKKRDSAMSVFKEKYSEQERYTILALNRLDEKNSWRADTLIIPNKFYDNFLKYSPFPAQVDLLKKVKKFVYFSYPIQAFAVYENGDLKKWGPTSLGKKSAKTATGLHFTNWKKKLAISTVDSDWKLPYNVNIANRLGIGWHEYDLPGFPASHSCLRLLKNDAEWMYSFAEQWVLTDNGNTVKANGIPVIVNGDYNWGGERPWLKLLNNSTGNQISEKELAKNIHPFIEKILAEQKNREKVLSEMQ
ncbi:L,D-transpeptidase [Halpernia sp.]|uniref:L,D-transpeptidase n=1 Tax=Halpernia sp. TaxID=2782209 RepID=UPI003A937A40